jgi:PAS domain S-box-containing protein
MHFKYCRWLVILFLNLAVFFFLLPTPSQAQQQRVLFISSYHPGFPTFSQQIDGMTDIFNQENIFLDIEFMDTKRFPSEQNLHNFRQLLSYKLDRSPAYDAIVTGDDVALKFAIAEQTGLFKNLPIVFLGVNNMKLALAQNDNPWITGTVEKVSMRETLELMHKMHPQATTFVAIVDGTTTGQIDLQTFYGIQKFLPEVHLSQLSLADMSYEELGQQLAALREDTVVLLLSAYHDREGRSLVFKDNLHFITSHLSRPLYHIYYHGMGAGIVGGKLVSHFQQGQTAARMVLAILGGTPITSLPVNTDSFNRYVFDFRELQRFGLALSELPADSVILNRPISAFRKYRQGILVVAALLVFGIALALLLLGHLRQRQEAEEALRKSEERFRSIVHFSPMGVLLYQLYPNDKLILMGSNTAARDILHLDLDTFIGKTIEEVFPKLVGTGIPEKYRQVCSLGTAWSSEQVDYNAPPINGSFEVHAFQTAPGKMACFFRDISERTKAEQTLKEALINARSAREHLETILNSVSDGLLFTDLDSRIMLMSRSAEELLGKTLGDVYGRDVRRVVENEALLKSLKVVASGTQEESIVEISLPTPHENKFRIVQAKLAAVRNEEGLKRGIITLLRDISRERELDLMKTEFISTAAHELRTPLTSVIGFSELLIKQGGLNDQQDEFLTIIHKKAEALGKIVEDLLDLARVDTGQVIRLKKDWADVRSILTRCVSDYKRVCDNHRFKMVLPDGPISMQVDDRKLFQVMENLLGNAVKFSPVDSTIQVTCQMADDEVYIAVSDQGIGMNPDQISRMFDKFYRVDASNTAREGLGLGMAIVKSIVEAHQGRIWVTSKPDKGTTVTFTLPRIREQEDRASQNV